MAGPAHSAHELPKRVPILPLLPSLPPLPGASTYLCRRAITSASETSGPKNCRRSAGSEIQSPTCFILVLRIRSMHSLTNTPMAYTCPQPTDDQDTLHQPRNEWGVTEEAAVHVIVGSLLLERAADWSSPPGQAACRGEAPTGQATSCTAEYGSSHVRPLGSLPCLIYWSLELPSPNQLMGSPKQSLSRVPAHSFILCSHLGLRATAEGHIGGGWRAESTGPIRRPTAKHSTRMAEVSHGASHHQHFWRSAGRARKPPEAFHQTLVNSSDKTIQTVSNGTGSPPTRCQGAHIRRPLEAHLTIRVPVQCDRC